jgi:hypothetical protein
MLLVRSTFLVRAGPQLVTIDHQPYVLSVILAEMKHDKIARESLAHVTAPVDAIRPMKVQCFSGIWR